MLAPPGKQMAPDEQSLGCSTGPRRVGGALLHQHAKSLFFVANDALEVPVSSAAMSYRLGLRLEIVPMLDPLPLLPGDALPVQVRFDGPELAKARIVLRWARPGGGSQVVFQGTGDDVGSLDLPLEKPGRYLVTVVHEHVGSTGDREVHHATLTFPIGVR